TKRYSFTGRNYILVSQRTSADMATDPDQPPPSPATDDENTLTNASDDALPLRNVGPYMVIRKIGEGGMGIVYQARQLEPFRRDVALKLIKPGMDSRQVIARFESERQALA